MCFSLRLLTEIRFLQCREDDLAHVAYPVSPRIQTGRYLPSMLSTKAFFSFEKHECGQYQGQNPCGSSLSQAS